MFLQDIQDFLKGVGDFGKLSTSAPFKCFQCPHFLEISCAGSRCLCKLAPKLPPYMQKSPSFLEQSVHKEGSSLESLCLQKMDRDCELIKIKAEANKIDFGNDDKFVWNVDELVTWKSKKSLLK